MRKFWLDCLLATMFVFLLLWGIQKFTQLNIFNAFDSIGQALNDVELTDYVFLKLRDDPKVDERIVMVNIGKLPRAGIGREIQILSKYKPKVIGVDSFFNCGGSPEDTVNCPQLKDSLGNLILSDAIREAGNVVLVSKALTSDSLAEAGTEDTFDSLERSDFLYRQGAYGEGYASLETDAAYQDDAKTCRTFNPQLTIGKETHYAFSVKMAMAYDSVKTKKFLARNNFSEIINYRGNVMDLFHQTNYPQMFYTLDAEDVLNENFVSGVIEGNVVILGYLGDYIGDPSWNDKFYTPLNKKMAGKANPDMFGAVVHANAVSMILNEDYVEQMKDWQEYLLAFIICFLNVALFSAINRKLPDWYDGITKMLQLLQLLLFSILMVMVFHWNSFKLNITVTLAVVAIAGDAFEVYNNILKNFFLRFRGFRRFTNLRE